MKREQLEVLVNRHGTLVIGGMPFAGTLKLDGKENIYLDKDAGANPQTGEVSPPGDLYFEYSACTLFMADKNRIAGG